mmetsp:Transcript_29198/g.90259  ORF Transcript_29198/g.90259 Transcript_29198/m.90259 type:complete len:196 (-) Transcript_29198:546-1133(-)
MSTTPTARAICVAAAGVAKKLALAPAMPTAVDVVAAAGGSGSGTGAGVARARDRETLIDAVRWVCEGPVVVASCDSPVSVADRSVAVGDSVGRVRVAPESDSDRVANVREWLGDASERLRVTDTANVGSDSETDGSDGDGPEAETVGDASLSVIVGVASLPLSDSVGHVSVPPRGVRVVCEREGVRTDGVVVGVP